MDGVRVTYLQIGYSYWLDWINVTLSDGQQLTGGSSSGANRAAWNVASYEDVSYCVSSSLVTGRT